MTRTEKSKNISIIHNTSPLNIVSETFQLHLVTTN